MPDTATLTPAPLTPAPTAEPTDRLSCARQSGLATAETISALYAVVQFGQEDCEGRDLDREAKQLLRDFGYPHTLSREDAAHAAADYAREMPLSVLVRNGWHTPGESGDAEPEEFELLLSTGGPAVRVYGYLGAYGSIRSAELQVQDWGTQWERLPVPDPESLDWFATLFFDY